MYNINDLVRKPTCLKNPNKLSCIDPPSRNREKSFQNNRCHENILTETKNKNHPIQKLQKILGGII